MGLMVWGTERQVMGSDKCQGAESLKVLKGLGGLVFHTLWLAKHRSSGGSVDKAPLHPGLSWSSGAGGVGRACRSSLGMGGPARGCGWGCISVWAGTLTSVCVQMAEGVEGGSVAPGFLSPPCWKSSLLNLQ